MWFEVLYWERFFSKKDPFNDKSMESELQKTTSEESNLRSKWDDNIGSYLADALVGRVWKEIEQKDDSEVEYRVPITVHTDFWIIFVMQ